MPVPIDKRKWFDVPDSLVDREDGEGSYYNVEARFADHPVLNPEKSRIARHNVYDLGIVLHTRVKRVGGDVAAQKNMSARVLRFDKGDKLSETDFATAKKEIKRCWEAWEHYQRFRRSPVTAAERLALTQIAAAPQKSTGVLVDMGGELVPYEADPDAGIDEEQIEEEQRASLAKIVKKPRKQPKKKAA